VLAAAEVTNLFLYDLKHMDSQRHEELTGYPNELILDNARRLDELGAHMWIRIPLIPGMNDDQDNLAQACRFISSLNNVRAVQFLPYHNRGEKKRSQLTGVTKNCLSPASKESVEQKVEQLRPLLSVPVSIGG